MRTLADGKRWAMLRAFRDPRGSACVKPVVPAWILDQSTLEYEMKKELGIVMAAVGLLATSIPAFAFTGQEFAREAKISLSRRVPLR